jgi:hypothetical protein
MSCSLDITPFTTAHYVALYPPSTETHVAILYLKNSYFLWIDTNEATPTPAETNLSLHETLSTDSDIVTSSFESSSRPYLPKFHRLAVGVPGNIDIDPSGTAITLLGNDNMTDLSTDLARRLGKFPLSIMLITSLALI